ncbi:hypothetical protein [Pseudomonas sp.]|uniref:hypothetical protein n=1 Tax=Pseudomonas sp. TaxID=306 RepID=UPI003FD84FEB
MDEATTRTEIAAGFAQPANDSGTLSLAMNGAAAINHVPPLPHLSGSAPVILKAQQAQLRREGEKSAAEQLDAEQAARRRSDQDVVELCAQLAYKDAQITQLRDDAEQDRRALSQAIRQQQEDSDLIISMEERLEDVMALAECLRADSEVSPPEFRLAFECWRTITRDGTHNPAGAGGRGVHGLVEDWLKDNGYKLNKEATERLCAVVSWRKRGAGAIRSK